MSCHDSPSSLDANTCAGAGAGVETRRVGAVGREPVAQDGEVGLLLRQPVRQRLPRSAGVGRPPDRELAVGRAAVHVALEREEVGGVGLGRVGDDGEAEVHPGDARHRRPLLAAVVAAIDAAVVLEVQPLRVGGVAGDLVHALAELGRRRVGQERNGDAGVARLPRLAAVVAAIDAGRRDGDEDAGRVVRMDEHGVQAQPASARLPLRAMRVVPQTTDELERAPAVVAAEQRRRLDTGVEHVGLVGRARCQLPDPRQRRLGAVREVQCGLLVLGPRRAEVVGPPQHRPPVVAHRADEQPRRAAARVDARRVDLLAGEHRLGHVEVLAPVVGTEDEQALGGPDEDHRVCGHGWLDSCCRRN